MVPWPSTPTCTCRVTRVRRVPAQMWASPGADVGQSRRRCGPVPAQMWASAAANVGQSRRRCGPVPAQMCRYQPPALRLRSLVRAIGCPCVGHSEHGIIRPGRCACARMGVCRLLAYGGKHSQTVGASTSSVVEGMPPTLKDTLGYVRRQLLAATPTRKCRNRMRAQCVHTRPPARPLADTRNCTRTHMLS